MAEITLNRTNTSSSGSGGTFYLASEKVVKPDEQLIDFKSLNETSIRTGKKDVLEYVLEDIPKQSYSKIFADMAEPVIRFMKAISANREAYNRKNSLPLQAI